MNRFTKIFSLITLALAVPFLMAGSFGGAEQAAHEMKNVTAQQDAMNQATTAVPVPKTNHFLARQALAEYMKRMDTPGKTWFVYERGENGNTVNYYVASTYPQSVCTFMTPPEEVKRDRWSNGGGYGVVVTAPALDGIYYKGGGCDVMFFFDAETDAMILTSMRITVADQPLSLEGEPVQVQITSDDAN